MRRVRPSWDWHIQIVNHIVRTESTQWVRIVLRSSSPLSEMRCGSADKGEGPTRSLRGQARMCQKKTLRPLASRRGAHRGDRIVVDGVAVGFGGEMKRVAGKVLRKQTSERYCNQKEKGIFF